jgi:hypothetical protein
MLSAGALVAAVLALAALNAAVQTFCLWWDVSNQVGHKAAAVVLLPPLVLLLLSGILANLAREAWQALRDEFREEEIAEARELQARRDDLELSQKREEAP